ncbi:glycoside hydrolase family 15 protein (plasmid) [Lichenicola cladoniae]|uniref:Trehalase n=1 Tax=Lichenicola cladoniae TaxID=1484109 RepID=A0A6M8HXW3_9PROT|nr:glycoside hydrolase family 15 protein [Lichenicola cladoniae]NPD70323.1 glycoside hydrolase family 15 protein [Acetobacteraceae bacterium]QKE92941.1 glycoside hydrolase family 15 protein [Lichenicola cladoniae]
MDTPDSDAPLRIEDYALIGDCLSAALVGRNGSIDWLCWPRFDSEACFAALLGTSKNGRWLLAPDDAEARISRSYRGDTMVLETIFETKQGSIALIDFMPIGRENSSIVRRVEGRSGRVAMHMQISLRFDYGSSTPWVTQLEDGGGISAVLGPNLVVLRTPVELEGRDRSTFATFDISAGEHVDFTLGWGQSHLPLPAAFEADEALQRTDSFWRDWSAQCRYKGRWRQLVLRSLLTLKALTYAPTGGIVAAPTTSLPEQLGGVRNWDYRFCWLRDASLTLIALMEGGYREEARAWYQWLHRAVAGTPEELQIMYGVGGERRLVEWSPSWLPGYEGSAPVNIGNAASEQLQLDIHGEVIGALHIARAGKLAEPHVGWTNQVLFVEHLERIWEQPDDGIWEVRGGRRHFTHSKVMAWVALDCSIQDAEAFDLPAPVERWKDIRARMHSDICSKGFDTARNTFTQSYGRPELDASLLLIPRVGFLPADDPRVQGTIAAVERELLVDGFVLRYRTDGEDAGDGLPPGEGAFLPCSFWLVNAYALQGRQDKAEALFNKLIGLVNDVGLISEEYDAKAGRQVGNFPQAFSHLALMIAALTLDRTAAAP